MSIAADFRHKSRERWAASAGGWEAQQQHMRTNSMPVSAWLIDAVDPQPGQTVLELAAGVGDTGLLAAELIAPSGTLISSDFSPEMLASARRLADKLGISNVRFKQIDADTSFDIEAASIDAVFCRWGYMLMADPVHALRETRRILKPGGRVALAAWTGSEYNAWLSTPYQILLEVAGAAVPGEPEEPGPFTWAEQGEIDDNLAQAGFTENPLIDRVDFHFDFQSAQDWWDRSLSLSGNFRRAVGELSAQALAESEEKLARLAEQYARKDGTLKVPASTWVARATA